MSTPEDPSAEMLAQLRMLSHRLSNSLEVIMQAQYLLQRPREASPHVSKQVEQRPSAAGKNPHNPEPLDKDHNAEQQEARKWTIMIGNAAEEAADTNRKIRDTVRRLSALQAPEANPVLALAAKRNKKNAGPLG